MIIEEYNESDKFKLIKCWELSIRESQKFLSDEFLEIEKRNILEKYLNICETSVVKINNEVAGFLSSIDHEIGGLFVSPFYQKRGIGSALVNKFKENKRRNLLVKVFSKNENAINFYRSMGFIPFFKELHLESGEKLIHMATKLVNE